MIIKVLNKHFRQETLLSVHKLSTYGKKVYVSKKLTTEERILGNNFLRKSREIINQRFQPKNLRLRDLKSQRLQLERWVAVYVDPAENWLCKQNSVDFLVIIVHSLFNPDGRFVFANAWNWNSSVEILCLTETWLLETVTAEALFLWSCVIYRAHRENYSLATSYDGMLFVVKGIPQNRLGSPESGDCDLIELRRAPTFVILCCL